LEGGAEVGRIRVLLFIFRGLPGPPQKTKKKKTAVGMLSKGVIGGGGPKETVRGDVKGLEKDKKEGGLSTPFSLSPLNAGAASKGGSGRGGKNFQEFEDGAGREAGMGTTIILSFCSKGRRKSFLCSVWGSKSNGKQKGWHGTREDFARL